MYFQHLSTKHILNIPEDSEFYWLENAIKVDHVPTKQAHDNEHLEMLKRWGLNPSQVNSLTYRLDESGEEYLDRFYHCLLHIRYWKEINIQTNIIDKFEKQAKINIMDLTLPNPNVRFKADY